MPKTASRFVDFRAVKAAVSMEQVLEHYRLMAGFKRSNDSLSGPCPIHQGTNPTQFRVSLTKNCWNCFSECKCGGNVLDFVAKMDNVDPMEAANRLVEWFGLERAQLNAAHDRDAKDQPAERSPRGSPAGDAQVAEVLPPPPTAPPAKPNPPPGRPPKEEVGPNRTLSFKLELDPSHPYLTERGLSPDTVDEFGIGYCAKGVMSGRIAIPIHNAGGELVGYAGRWPGVPPDGRPKYRLPDGFKKSVEVFRLAQALREPPEAPLVIVEGYFGVMKLWQHGVRKCVALMGCSMSMAQEKLLLEHLAPDSRAIVVFDQNEAGFLGRGWVLQRLSLRAFVRVVSFSRQDCQPDHLTADEVQLLKLT